MTRTFIGLIMTLACLSLAGCGSENKAEVIFDAGEHAKTTASPEEVQRRMAEAMAGAGKSGKARGAELKAEASKKSE
ncbi:hypothetical protein RISK_004839 [Rhodopirellula islandica]|uniref:Signal peptide and transmembrane protein n=1 Tax=Rhodopirellula islandica TaxID=595434 RepID=A0A0J1B963_RHOIS|nr:hypothetical protein [Rhodopirellula islandica]KLU03073.1 hypothetical protein RISK_004839 [Rhodopirellula islandica]